jgi:spermidine/putrescine-binding protein
VVEAETDKNGIPVETVSRHVGQQMASGDVLLAMAWTVSEMQA